MHLVYSTDEHPTNWHWWSKIHSILSIFRGRLSFKQVWGWELLQVSSFFPSVWKLLCSRFIMDRYVHEKCYLSAEPRNYSIISSTQLIVAVFVPFVPSMTFLLYTRACEMFFSPYIFLVLLWGRSFCRQQHRAGSCDSIHDCSHVATTVMWLPNHTIMNGAISDDY